MYLFTAELIDVQDGEFRSLIFKSQKWDRYLNQNVPMSMSVGIGNDLAVNIPNYKKHIGEKILIGVEPRITKDKKGIFAWATTDVLDVTQLLTSN